MLATELLVGQLLRLLAEKKQWEINEMEEIWENHLMEK
jgi:hypothetical protein